MCVLFIGAAQQFNILVLATCISSRFPSARLNLMNLNNNSEGIRFSTNHLLRNHTNKSLPGNIGESIESLIERLNTEKSKNQKCNREIERLNDLLKEREQLIEQLTKENQYLKNLLNGVSNMVGQAIADDSETGEQAPDKIPLGPPSAIYIGQVAEVVESKLVEPKTGTQIQFRVPYKPTPQQKAAPLVQSNFSQMVQSAVDTEEENTSVRAKMLGMARINPSITGVFSRGRSQDFSVMTTSSNSITTKITRNNESVSAPLRLFQNFIIISAVESSNQKSFEPKIVQSYPQIDKADRINAIEGYCFPHGTPTKIIKSKQQARQTLLNEFTEVSIFTIRSDLNIDRTKTISNILLDSVNPSQVLYGVCMKVFGVSKTATNNTFYETHKSYIFLTYFPFIAYFLRCLQDLINAIKKQQIECLPEVSNSLLAKLIPLYLTDLNKITLSGLSINYRYKWMDSTLTLAIPDKLHVEEFAIGYCVAALGVLEVQILTDLFLMMLLEESIHIYSSNVRLLSQIITMLTFSIRPFKYPFPIVYNLPLSKYPLLESPLPTLIGLTIPEESFSAKYSMNLSNSRSLYFNLDTNQITRYPNSKQLYHCRSYIRSIFAKCRLLSKQPVDMYRKMRSVMKHEILGAKEGESLMTPFIKKFMETQMYSNYKQEISEGNTPEIEGVD